MGMIVCWNLVLKSTTFCRARPAQRSPGLVHEAIKAYNNFINFASPEFAEDVKEIKGVIQDLENRIWGKYGELRPC